VRASNCENRVREWTECRPGLVSYVASGTVRGIFSGSRRACHKRILARRERAGRPDVCFRLRRRWEGYSIFLPGRGDQRLVLLVKLAWGLHQRIPREGSAFEARVRGWFRRQPLRPMRENGPFRMVGNYGQCLNGDLLERERYGILTFSGKRSLRQRGKLQNVRVSTWPASCRATPEPAGPPTLRYRSFSEPSLKPGAARRPVCLP
jgi:hypothetical protein